MENHVAEMGVFIPIPYYGSPERYHVHKLVLSALKLGEIEYQPCIVCGCEQNIHFHHEDYSKPLDVTCLCRTCHGQLHNRRRDTGLFTKRNFRVLYTINDLIRQKAGSATAKEIEEIKRGRRV